MRQLKIVKQITNREHKSLDKYLQEIGSVEMVTADEEVELAVRIRNGDEQALERLVNANLRFVVSVAKQYQNQGLPLGDLINEGNLGLIKAAQRFDETRGFKFISYAVWWIRQSILQSLAEQARMIRLPLNRIGALSKINKAAALLEQRFEREPSTAEIAVLLELTEDNIQEYLNVAPRHISIDAPINTDDESSLSSTMENTDEPKPDHVLMRESLQSQITNTLTILSEKERCVVSYFFGINQIREHSLEEISSEMDLTRERVRQIKENAIRKLRNSKRTAQLKAYLG
ncbi:MAG: RNA polymerase sigma factor RpoD/SigA [Sphingobacteriales bacterium]|nr:MAG: RNA polymerase sigma factor RpoD/SigA [Sphingobacteriales bacterium]